jgi:hypothetical protein
VARMVADAPRPGSRYADLGSANAPPKLLRCAACPPFDALVRRVERDGCPPRTADAIAERLSDAIAQVLRMPDPSRAVG